MIIVRKDQIVIDEIDQNSTENHQHVDLNIQTHYICLSCLSDKEFKNIVFFFIVSPRTPFRAAPELIVDLGDQRGSPECQSDR